MNYYKEVIKKYATFSGRARRKEYWTFVLVHVSIIIMFIGAMMMVVNSTIFRGLFVLFLIYLLFTLIPGIAVLVRRLHDTGRSGWWLLIIFFPPLNIALLVFLIMKSDPMDNAYGPSPIKKTSTKN